MATFLSKGGPATVSGPVPSTSLLEGQIEVWKAKHSTDISGSLPLSINIFLPCNFSLSLNQEKGLKMQMTVSDNKETQILLHCETGKDLKINPIRTFKARAMV
jgi:hypothetical protein